MNEGIERLKAEIFDIMREQGRHQQEINRLQQIKAQKLAELEVLETRMAEAADSERENVH